MSETHSFGGGSLASRAVSAFPVSIATSLSLESIFAPRQPPYDPNREIPNRIDVSQYQECYFNVATLFRNMFNATSKDVFTSVSESDIRDALEFEIDVINSLFRIEGHDLCKPVYYYCTYKGLFSKTPKDIRFREDKTDQQRLYHHKLVKTIQLLEDSSPLVKKYDSDIRPEKLVNAMMMTHSPYDLLSYTHFAKLDLLESNTGRLKSRGQWNSKYYPIPDADMSILPFNRKLLLLFGDKSMIQPAPIKLRKEILDVAKTREWTSMTTMDKVMLDLELSIKEPYVLQLIKKL